MISAGQVGEVDTCARVCLGGGLGEWGGGGGGVGGG